LQCTLAKDCNKWAVVSLKRKAGLFFPLSKKSVHVINFKTKYDSCSS
jgi:hypothetical protein